MIFFAVYFMSNLAELLKDMSLTLTETRLPSAPVHNI